MDEAEVRERQRKIERQQRRSELVQKRKLLLDELEAVRQSLVENEENADHFIEAYDDPKPISKSEYHGLLATKGRGFSSAGVQAARKMFDALDSDGDGVLNFLEFRGYLVAVDQLHEFDETVLKSEDAFKSYMHDLYEISNDGLTFGGFLALRFAMEDEHSLVDDLEKLGHETMNDMMQQHRLAADSFDWFDTHGDGHLPKEDFQLLCCKAGLSMYNVQCDKILQRQQVINEAMQMVRTRYAKKRFYAFEQISLVDPEDKDNIYRDAFIAWWVSANEATRIEGWRKKLLQAKLFSHLSIREIMRTANFAREQLHAAVDSRILAALSTVKDQKASYDMLLEVGDVSDDEMAVDVSYSTTEAANDAVKAMDYGDADAQGYFYIDFLARADTTADVLQLAAKHLKELIEQHFKKQLEEVPAVLGWTVVRALNEVDSANVLRFIVFFNEMCDPLLQLQTAGLPLDPVDVLQDFKAEFNFGISLFDMFDRPKGNWEEDFMLRVALHATVGSKVLSQVVEEAIMNVLDKHQEDGELEQALVRRAEEAARMQTINDAHRTAKADDTVHSGGTPDSTNTGQSAENKAGSTGKGRREGYRQSDGSKETKIRRRQAWQRVLSLCHYVKHTRATNMEWRFDSILHMLARSKYVSQVLLRTEHHKWLRAVTKSGEITRIFRRFIARFIADWKELQEEIRAKFAEKQRLHQEEIMAQGGEETDTEKQIRLIREKVQGLELKAQKEEEKAKRQEEGLPVDDDEDEQNDIPQVSPEEASFQADVKFMEFYENFWPALIGVHAVTLHCGSVRFRGLCHGLDIMELLPDPSEHDEEDD